LAAKVIFLTTGTRRAIIESMTAAKLRRELAPAGTGGDEHSILGALGGAVGQRGLAASRDR
jgi:hypothetical protein